MFIRLRTRQKVVASARLVLHVPLLILLSGWALLPSSAHAAGRQSVEPIEPAPAPCEAGIIEIRTASEVSYGWTGLAHNLDLAVGTSIGFRILHRCTDNQAACTSDGDCGNNECVATCDCIDDTSCEVVGPTQTKRCQTTLTPCATNGDCPSNVACLAPFGPPLPSTTSALCMLNFLEAPLTGTADSSSGELRFATSLRMHAYLGTSISQPCPRCGNPDVDPHVGEMFTCEGGPNTGAPCTVDGVTPDFGGTSFDCAPNTASDLTGSGVVFCLNEVTTGTTTKTAHLPCKQFGFGGNPTIPASNPRCLDNNAPCTSNADCKRCTSDSSTACTTNDDCPGNGDCVAAPEQPVTCGFWCHCGFCSADPSAPCFDSGDCPNGQNCVVGVGSEPSANIPQAKPNDCREDSFICGKTEPELCTDTQVGKCSLQPYRSCMVGSGTCETNAAGICIASPQPCFGPRISRSGSASPVSGYCELEMKGCGSSLDCTGEGDRCVEDASVPATTALFCMPASSKPAINSTLGITGPGAMQLQNFMRFCRCPDGATGCPDPCATTCGDGQVTLPEVCDDGDTQWEDGEFCNASCQAVACGDPNDSASFTSTDALYALRTAVGLRSCSAKVCDVNNTGTITASDGLRILRKAVGQTVTLTCPAW